MANLRSFKNLFLYNKRPLTAFQKKLFLFHFNCAIINTYTIMPYMYGYICLCIHTPYITWVHVHVNSHYNVSTFNIPLLHNSKSLVLLTMLPHNDQNKQTNQLHGRAFKHRFVKFGVIVRVSKPQLQAQLGNVSIQTIFINDLVNLRNSGEYQKHRMQSQTLGISHLEQEIKCPNRVLGGQG